MNEGQMPTSSGADAVVMKVVNEWQECVKEVFTLEEQLKDAKERQRRFELTTLPAMFDEREWHGLVLANGRSVLLKEVLHVSLAKDADVRKEALEFLRQANSGNAIKQELNIAGDDVETAMSALAEIGVSFELQENIHPQTLKSVVGELLGLKEGTTSRFVLEELPKGLGAFVERKVELK